MSSPFDHSAGLDEDFPGEVRLFPLPDVVLFPHVLMQLHIFEPRYVEMTGDALRTDKLIAMAQLKPGWELGDLKHPELDPVICIGRIVHCEELEGGRYNIVLQGLQRARIIQELPFEHLYRQASVDVLEDEPIRNVSQEDQRRAQLLTGFRKLFPTLKVEAHIEEMFESVIPLGVLCDVFGYALSLTPADAQRLLGESNVERRSQLLIEFMNQALAVLAETPKREFPPPFSLN
jgi:Lon protease-like protein